MKPTFFNPPHQSSRPVLLVARCTACAAMLSMLVGCQSFQKRSADWMDLTASSEASSLQQADDLSRDVQGIPSINEGGVVQAGGIADPSAPANSVVQADGDSAAYYESRGSENRLVNFLTEWRKDVGGAKKQYQLGHAAFRDATNDRKSPKTFSKAANLFRKAGDSAPGSALQQDSLFMQAESHFFANELTEATKIYQQLQKDFPRNRHSDRVAARLFAISRYWIDASKAGADKWYKINLFDNSLPSYDAKGNAVKVLDQIRYDDPTGRLADDATMAAAAEFIRQKEFDKADEFLTDLRETFSDSDHMFLAHILGIRCKLNIYSGPQYSGLILEEAETLIRQTRERFPDRLREQNYAEMVAKAAAEVEFRQAERLMNRARYRENRGEFRAATSEYRRLLRDYPNAPQAKQARGRLGNVAGEAPIPEKRLAWLTNIFPDSKSSSPLILSNGKTQTPQSGGRMLR